MLMGQALKCTLKFEGRFLNGGIPRRLWIFYGDVDESNPESCCIEACETMKPVANYPGDLLVTFNGGKRNMQWWSRNIEKSVH